MRLEQQFDLSRVCMLLGCVAMGCSASTDGSEPGNCVTRLAVGVEHACALRSDGTIWCWGVNRVGQLGQSDLESRSKPTKVGLANVHDIAAGWSHTCAVLADSTARCWGSSEFGQVNGTFGAGQVCWLDSPNLGSENCVSTPIDVTGLGSGVVRIALGAYHSCALKNDGTAWCWGMNYQGQLGVEKISQLEAATQVVMLGGDVSDLALGGYHSCARKSDGTLWCWGANNYGQLGNGTSTGSPCNGGNACHPQPAPVTALADDVAQVALGLSHSCGLKTDGTVWCWGANDFGQLGDATTAPKTSPIQVTALGDQVAEIASGSLHTCAIKKDGTLWCWGANGAGALGDGTDTGDACGSGIPCKSTPVQATALSTGVSEVRLGGGSCVRANDGVVRCWGLGVVQVDPTTGDSLAKPKEVGVPCP